MTDAEIDIQAAPLGIVLTSAERASLLGRNSNIRLEARARGAERCLDEPPSIDEDQTILGVPGTNMTGQRRSRIRDMMRRRLATRPQPQ